MCYCFYLCAYVAFDLVIKSSLIWLPVPLQLPFSPSGLRGSAWRVMIIQLMLCTMKLHFMWTNLCADLFAKPRSRSQPFGMNPKIGYIAGILRSLLQYEQRLQWLGLHYLLWRVGSYLPGSRLQNDRKPPGWKPVYVFLLSTPIHSGFRGHPYKVIHCTKAPTNLTRA